MNEKKQYRAPAIERAAKIIDYLSITSREGSLSEIARHMDLGKSSVLGILRGLQEVGWVAREGDSYTLGPKLLSMALGRELLRVARPFMEELADRFGNTVCVGRPVGDSLMVEGSVEGRGSMRIAVKPGLSLPIFAAATGKALFSAMEPGAVNDYIADDALPAYTPNSITDPLIFEEELKKCRNAGYASDDEEFMRGVRAVAAPVLREGKPLAVLWSVGFSSTMEDSVLEKTGAELWRASGMISRLLSGR